MLTKEEAYRIKKRLELDLLKEQRDATLKYLLLALAQIDELGAKMDKTFINIDRAIVIWYFLLIGVALSLVLEAFF